MDDPALQLLAVFLLVHVIEGGLVVRRSAYVFMGAAGRKFSVTQGIQALLGNQRWAAVLLSPLPPFKLGFVTEIPELTIGEKEVLPYAVQRPGRNDVPIRVLPLSHDELLNIWVDGKTLRAEPNASVVAHTSSSLLAERLANESKTFAESTQLKRQQRTEARIEALHDIDSIKERYLKFCGASRRIAVLGPLVWLSSMGLLFSVFYVPWVYAHGIELAVGVVLLWGWTLFEVWRVHSLFYPNALKDRLMTLLLLGVSLPALARAQSLVARDLLIGFHPLAVGQVLLDAEDFRRWATTIWRDLVYPALEWSESSTAQSERKVMIGAHQKLLAGAGVAVEDLDQPPEELQPNQAFCPRCHIIYESSFKLCSECKNVELVPWSKVGLYRKSPLN